MDLVGRDDEIRRVRAAVDGVRTGPQSLLLLGEAGTGKTSLLKVGAGAAAAAGHAVLRGQGCEAEADQPFAVLNQLLRPLLPQIDALPPQAGSALRTAVGLLHEPAPTEAVAIRTGVLGLLEAVSSRQPLVVVVDDLQLVDRDTSEVLTFVLRRLTTERIALLLAARSTVRPAQIEAGVPLLELGPLSDVAAARLVDDLPDPPTGSTRVDVLHQAAGNPLALVEFAAVAAREGGLGEAGTAPAARLQDMFAAQLARLPETTRTLLLYAAAAQHEDLATIMGAAGRGDDLSGWRPAEEAGLVAVGRRAVAFRHPLVRAAAYESAPAGLRLQAHRDFAALLVDDPVRHAGHLAEASIAPDEEVAAALERTASVARLRGGVHTAAKAFQRAAERTPDRGERARRYVLAIAAADDYGDPAWIRELHDRVVELTTDPDLRGAAATAAGHGLSLSGHQREAFALLDHSLAHALPPHPGTAISLTGVLTAVAVQSGLPEHAAAAAEHIRQLTAGQPDHPDGPLPAVTHPAMIESIRVQNRPERYARAVLESPGSAVNRPLRGPAEIVRLLCLGSTAWFADASDLAVDAFRRARSALGPGGPLGSVVMTLPALGSALIDTGRWTDATAILDELADLAVVHRHRYLEADVAALRTELAVLRGTCDHSPEPSAWTAVELDENRITHARLLRAAGLAAGLAGDHEASFRHLRALFDRSGRPLHYFLSARSIAELAVAARAVGAQDQAGPLVAAVRAAHGEHPTTRMRLQLHRAEALLAEGHAPDDVVERSHRLAVIDPAGQQWPLERALARLHYARWLRRHRSPTEARPLLSSAHDTFTQLGAAALAETARSELRASGGSARSSPAVSDPLAALTPQQREVVLLAARGLRNKEIADQLYLSPRTVGSHLHAAYPKLGVTGRHQLRELIGDLPEA
ncbi:LuxR family transcriptional regulator [Pseudonocardia ailaonensis]|uniref:LuxR family transcriptional regulator n=1 Tax=Pseudonocardia ailaonensis TaxID=367279 RepID=A0ABN2NEI5_9PSEU